MALHRERGAFVLYFFQHGCWTDLVNIYVQTHTYICVCVFSHVRPLTILWTVTLQAPLSMEFSQEDPLEEEMAAHSSILSGLPISN